VKRTILAVSVCLGASPVYATDWALNSTLSQTVEANNNEFLRTILAGGTLQSYSTINANAVALTPTSKFTFDGDISYRKYFGGTEGVPTESLAGDTKFHYETFGKDPTDRNYVDASWSRQSTAFALLGQLGVVTNASGFLDTSTIGGGIDRSISALDFFSVSARSTYTSYDPGTGGTPFTDSSATGIWRHKLNSIATLTASSNVEELNFANTLGTNVFILRENAGVEAALSSVLSFRGSAGVVYVQTENGSPTTSLTPSNGIATSTSGSASDFITDMLLTYKMLPDTTFTLAGLQTVAPSVVGSLTKQTTVRAGLARTVNSHSTISFAADATRQVALGSTTDFLSASVTYGYQLTREWNAQMTYRYLHRFAQSGSTSAETIDPVTGIPLVTGTGPASSNSIMVVVSRSVSILPNGY